ncbi:hydroxylysine kinase [Ciona intestinalis]
MEYPKMTVERAQATVETLYGFRVASVSKLNSYHDLNFLISTEDGNKFTLKVTSNSAGQLESLTTIIDVLNLLVKNGIKVPEPVPTKAGNIIETDEQKNINIILVKYLSGKLLENVQVKQNQLNDIAFECGKVFGQINQILMTYPVNNSHNRPELSWNLLNTSVTHKNIPFIEDKDLQKLCKDVIAKFEGEVLTKLSSLRKGLIHGDANTSNIIMQKLLGGDGLEQCWGVGGVIDFGDLHCSYYVFEVAIMLTYLMAKAVKCNCDMFTVADYGLKGYQAVLPLSDKEKDILNIVIAQRCVQSLSSASKEICDQPENTDYIIIDFSAIKTVLLNVKDRVKLV